MPTETRVSRPKSIRLQVPKNKKKIQVNLSNKYKSKHFARVFEDNCIKHKSESDEQLSITK